MFRERRTAIQPSGRGIVHQNLGRQAPRMPDPQKHFYVRMDGTPDLADALASPCYARPQPATAR